MARPGIIRARLACAATIALIAIAALAPSAQAQTGTCTSPGRTGRFFVTLTVDGVQRSALVNVPPSADGSTRLPVVLVYHGASSTGPATEAHLAISAIGDRYGFVAVYPTSFTDFFGYKASQGEDDVTFTSSLLDYLDSHVCVDDARIYATGGSNGGAFVARLACELSTRLAAVASVAGVYGGQPPCAPARPISILEIHGSRDRYNGWPPLGWEPVPKFLKQWTTLDGCPPGPPTYYRFARHVRLWNRHCADGTTVAHMELFGGVHQWPGARDLSGGPGVDFEVSASLAAWQFFQCQSLASPTGGPCPPRQSRAAVAAFGRPRNRR